MPGAFLTHPQLGDRLAIAIRVSLRYWAREHRGGMGEEEFIATRLRAIYPTLHLQIGKPVYMDVRIVASKRSLNDTYTFQFRHTDCGQLILDPCM